MPRKQVGFHNIHARISEKHFRVLQRYCDGGIEKLSASSIINMFLEYYVEQFVLPRMELGEVATHNALRKDLPKATKLVAQQIDPENNDG